MNPNKDFFTFNITIYKMKPSLVKTVCKQFCRAFLIVVLIIMQLKRPQSQNIRGLYGMHNQSRLESLRLPYLPTLSYQAPKNRNKCMRLPILGRLISRPKILILVLQIVTMAPYITEHSFLPFSNTNINVSTILLVNNKRLIYVKMFTFLNV